MSSIKDCGVDTFPCAGFSQAWAKMIDVESGYNPLVKDVALDSSGKIYAMVTYEQLDGTKVC